MRSKMVVVPHVRTGMQLYFARPVGAVGPIKIGASRVPAHRMEDLSRLSPIPVELICQTPGTILAERRLHQHFRDDRLHHEWFRPSEALLAFIEGVRSGVDVAALIPGLDPLQQGSLRRYRKMEEV